MKTFNKKLNITINTRIPFEVNVTNDIGTVDGLTNGKFLEVFVELFLVLQKLEVAFHNVEIISTPTKIKDQSIIQEYW